MSMDLVRRGLMVLLTTTRAVMVSGCIGVVSCRCHIAMIMWRLEMAYRQLILRTQISALAADDMTALMIWETVKTAPLLGGSL